MNRFIKSRIAPVGKDQKGFTLVELLVVVAIIVALAAIIIPNVVAFASKGETGAMNGEKSSVQTAMDAMMADKGVTSVTANTTGSAAVADFGAVPTEAGVGGLAQYIRKNPTKYFYCWDTKGIITNQQKTNALCP